MQQSPYSTLPPGYRLVAMPAPQASGALPLPPLPAQQSYLIPVSHAPPNHPSAPPLSYATHYSQLPSGPPPPYGYPVAPNTSIPPPYGLQYSQYSQYSPQPPGVSALFRPLPVPIYPPPPSHAPMIQPLPPPVNHYTLQRPVFDFAHAPGSLYHQRFQNITTAPAQADEVLREGPLGFSMTGDSFTPYWIRLQKDLLLCHEQRHMPPLWKIKLWGTSIAPFDERQHPARFMVITGLGQVFSFQADTPEDAVIWQSSINNAAVGNSKPAMPSVAPLNSGGPALQFTNAPPVTTDHKAPIAKISPPASAPAAVAPAAESVSGTTFSRRSQGGIGGFLSSLFEADYSKWLKELPQQKDAKRFAFEQLRLGMSDSDHTLGKSVEAFAMKVNASSALSDEEFAKVVGDILEFIRENIPFIGKTHLDLMKVKGWEEVAHRATEAAVMLKIYTRVSKLYEWKYRAENERHSAKNKEFLTVTPAHLNVPKLFWLSHTEDVELSEAELEKCMPPYFEAIELLKQLPTLKSASLKLDCLVDVGKRLCTCITKFWEGRIDPAKLIVGADDLLPIMTYVVVKARIPSLYSEAMLMQDLMSEQAAMEIGGYSLATLQTSLSHLMVLERREALQAGEDQLRAKRSGPEPVNKDGSSMSPSSRLSQSSAPPPEVQLAPAAASLPAEAPTAPASAETTASTPLPSPPPLPQVATDLAPAPVDPVLSRPALHELPVLFATPSPLHTNAEPVPLLPPPRTSQPAAPVAVTDDGASQEPRAAKVVDGDDLMRFG